MGKGLGQGNQGSRIYYTTRVLFMEGGGAGREGRERREGGERERENA